MRLPPKSYPMIRSLKKVKSAGQIGDILLSTVSMGGKRCTEPGSGRGEWTQTSLQWLIQSSAPGCWATRACLLMQWLPEFMSISRLAIRTGSGPGGGRAGHLLLLQQKYQYNQNLPNQVLFLNLTHVQSTNTRPTCFGPFCKGEEGIRYSASWGWSQSA